MTAPTIWEWPHRHRGTIESQFFLASTSLSATSPYTGDVTPYGPQVQRFMAKLTFPDKRGPDWRELSGFITRLRGISGAIRIVDYNRMRCGYDVEVDPTVVNWSDGRTWTDGRGWESGFMPPFVVAGEAKPGGENNLKLSGLPASISRALRMGDLFEHRPNGIPAKFGSLYEVVNDANSNADGDLRVRFEPPLRAGVASGDQIVLRWPTSVFSLASDQEGIISRSLGNIGSLGLNLTERLTAPQ